MEDEVTPVRRRSPPKPHYRALVGLHCEGTDVAPGQPVPDTILDALTTAGIEKFVRTGRLVKEE